MTTSGITNYTVTTNELLEDAARTIGVIREDETLTPGDSRYVMRRLNGMVKGWQAANLHLWTKQTVVLFLQKGQNTYSLSSTSSDHATVDYEKTTLDADYIAGASQVSFNDNVSANIDDNIGIELDEGSLFWTTISNVVDQNTVDLTAVLPSQASSGKLTYIYTTELDTPFNVLDALRTTRDNTDIEVVYNSYNQYFLLPNKDSLSTPTIYNYDRQRDEAVIRVWPTPGDVEYRLKLTILRKLQTFVSGANTPDFPQEWSEPIMLKLAVKISPTFGKTGTQRYQDLVQQADIEFRNVADFDNEQGSIYVQIDRRYYDEY